MAGTQQLQAGIVGALALRSPAEEACIAVGNLCLLVRKHGAVGLGTVVGVLIDSTKKQRKLSVKVLSEQSITSAVV